MRVKADWHTAVGDVDTSDPFALPAPVPAMVEQPGEAWPIIEHEPEHEPVVPPDLEAPRRELSVSPDERLRELIRAEAILFDKGVTCELKDRDWSHPTCVRCPERGSRGALCGIGVAQEALA